MVFAAVQFIAHNDPQMTNYYFSTKIFTSFVTEYAKEILGKKVSTAHKGLIKFVFGSKLYYRQVSAW